MRVSNTERTIKRDREEIQSKDKFQNGRVLDLQVEIHRLHGKTLGTKEAACPMKYQLAHIVKRSIGTHVAWEARLIMGVAKRGTKLETVRRKIENKELERRHC